MLNFFSFLLLTVLRGVVDETRCNIPPPNNKSAPEISTTMMQDKEDALVAVKTERNHYRSKLKSLTKEILNEHTINQKTRDIIANLRAENSSLKRELEV